MPKAFISYRREDSQDVSGRLYDHLVARWGPERVFKDVDSIPLGMDFREHLTDAVGRCEVMLVVIGPRWMEATREGRRRLEDPLDFVRIEVEAALHRGVPVVPVLVGGAAVPAPEDLPESLRPLAYRQASLLRPDPDFRGDVARIIHGVERMPARPSPAPAPIVPVPPPPPLPRRAPVRPSGPSLDERVLRAVGRGSAGALRVLNAGGRAVGSWANGAGGRLTIAVRSTGAKVRMARDARAAAKRAMPPPLPPAREVGLGLFWGVTGPLLLAGVVVGLILGRPWDPSSYDPSDGFGFASLLLSPGLALCLPLVVGSRTRLDASLCAVGGAVIAAAIGLAPFTIGKGLDKGMFLAWLVASAIVAAITVPLRATVFWGMPKDHAAGIGPPTAPSSNRRVTPE